MSNEVKAPWLGSYGVVPHTLTYPEGSMTAYLFEAAEKYPDLFAYEFEGHHVTYKVFQNQVRQAARALCAYGIRPGDRVSVCMPNCPQAVIIFYAINLVGAVANMIHPLSSEGEIAFYLEDSASVAAITLQQFYPKFVEVRKSYPLKKLIITSVTDALFGVMKFGYRLTQGRKISPVPEDAEGVIFWKDFLALGKSYFGDCEFPARAQDPAVILYSGGTTGKTKGILLSNRNFNALALQTVTMGNCFAPGSKILTVMPMFHGFGLGVSVHTALCAGGECILVPRVSVKL